MEELQNTDVMEEQRKTDKEEMEESTYDPAQQENKEDCAQHIITEEHYSQDFAKVQCTDYFTEEHYPDELEEEEKEIKERTKGYLGHTLFSPLFSKRIYV